MKGGPTKGADFPKIGIRFVPSSHCPLKPLPRNYIAGSYRIIKSLSIAGEFGLRDGGWMLRRASAADAQSIETAFILC